MRPPKYSDINDRTIQLINLMKDTKSTSDSYRDVFDNKAEVTNFDRYTFTVDTISAVKSFTEFTKKITFNAGIGLPILAAVSMHQNATKAQIEFAEKGYVTQQTILSLASSVVGVLAAGAVYLSPIGMAGALLSGAALTLGLLSLVDDKHLDSFKDTIADLWSSMMDSMPSIDDISGFLDQLTDALESGILDAFTGLADLLNSGLASLGIKPPGYIDDNINGMFNGIDRAVNAPRDPLVLDLDGDGVETVGTNAGILFDHDGDGVKHGTGWVKPDDGKLRQSISKRLPQIMN